MKAVAQLVYAALAADTTLPKIYWENVDSSLPTTEHLIVSLAQTEAGDNFLGTTSQNIYLLNINIGVKAGVGQIKAMDIGDKLILLFKKNTILQASPLVSVDVTPTYGTGYYDEKWYRIPLRILINAII